MIITSVEAQNRFGQLLDFAQREPITITRRGRPVAMLVAMQDYVAGHQQEAAAAAALSAGRKAIAAFRGAGKKGSAERLLTDRRADLSAETEPASTGIRKQNHA